MFRPNLEVADIFRRHGEAWRTANAGHLSLGQRRVMTAIEICRTAALGGHVECCEDCAHTRIAYNSCRNRHCNKCQWRAAAAWLTAREAELLGVPYFHFVFKLPSAIGAMAYQNKAKVYGLLFKAAAETLTTIAADRKHLGAKIGVIAVLHTWGQTLQHTPHLHCVVPGGGISPDGKRWIASKPRFFLPVRVLSRLFRRLFLEGLTAAFEAGELQFFADLAHLNQAKAFAATLAPLRTAEWVVYAKKTFAGPEQLLAYLARYTHRVAITNSRLLNVDETHVSFRWKDCRKGVLFVASRKACFTPLACLVWAVATRVSCWTFFLVIGQLWVRTKCAADPVEHGATAKPSIHQGLQFGVTKCVDSLTLVKLPKFCAPRTQLLVHLCAQYLDSIFVPFRAGELPAAQRSCGSGKERLFWF